MKAWSRKEPDTPAHACSILYLVPETFRLLMVPLLEYANTATDIPYNLPWVTHAG